MFVCPFGPFPTDPKFWKTFLLFLIFNFAFLNKIVKLKFSKCIVTVQTFTVLTQEVCVYPINVSTRLLDVTYKENYMIYIAFLRHSDLKKKKLLFIDLPTLPIFRLKGQTQFYVFRPYCVPV